MRKFTLTIAIALLGIAAKAQTLADFELLPLTASDTFYINNTMHGMDMGFDNGLAHFPYFWDTSWGGYWAGGFSYSNKTDSVTSGYMNQYSAKTAKGYNNSNQYAVIWCSDPVTYAYYTRMTLTGSAGGKSVAGFYVTNSTYAYNSMRDGAAPAKKFGGATGNDPDWFLLTIKGYRGGALTTDSVNFYLADFRSSTGSSDYIVKTWEWVNLLPLGHVDSLQFHLSSSDTAGGNMNTPAYFCMDDFKTNETSVGVNTAAVSVAKVYPNPAHNMLYVDVADKAVTNVAVADMSGKVVASYSVTGAQVAVNTAGLPAGVYVLQLTGGGKMHTAQFTKQ